MTALSWAWFFVAVVLGVAVVVVCVLLANVFRVITSTKDLIDGVTSQTVPLLGEVGQTVGLVNKELARVDSILSTAETMTATVGGMVNVISATVSSPLVKVSAFAWGVRRAAAKAAEGGEPAGRGRKRRRRR